MNVRSKSMVPMTAVGTIVQIAMVVAGHYNEFIKNNVFAIGGMLISLVVAAMWAAKGAASKGNAFGGGAIVGGVCAILGIAVSVILGDTDAAVLGFGTAGSAVAGGIGGIAAFALSGRKVATAG